MVIVVVAFTDDDPKSIAYKQFNDVDKAVAFYKTMLEKDDVHVISTRKMDGAKKT